MELGLFIMLSIIILLILDSFNLLRTLGYLISFLPLISFRLFSQNSIGLIGFDLAYIFIILVNFKRISTSFHYSIISILLYYIGSIGLINNSFPGIVIAISLLSVFSFLSFALEEKKELFSIGFEALIEVLIVLSISLVFATHLEIIDYKATILLIFVTFFLVDGKWGLGFINKKQTLINHVSDSIFDFIFVMAIPNILVSLKYQLNDMDLLDESIFYILLCIVLHQLYFMVRAIFFKDKNVLVEKIAQFNTLIIVFISFYGLSSSLFEVLSIFSNYIILSLYKILSTKDVSEKYKNILVALVCCLPVSPAFYLKYDLLENFSQNNNLVMSIYMLISIIVPISFVPFLINLNGRVRYE